MMRRLSRLAFACVLATLIAALPASLRAQGASFTVFDIGATPNPVGDQFYTTLTAFLLGNAGTPTGTVFFYQSNTSTSCSPYQNSGGYSASVGTNGVASVNYYASPAGTLPICAAYIPADGDPYATATVGVYLLTVNQPTLFTVSVPSTGIQGTALPFNFGLTTPSGQTAPTGTITLEDPNNNYAALGTATVTGGVISPNPISATLSGNSYYAVYSGDSNYASQSVYGEVLIENSLTSVSPAAILAGSGATNITLNGLGFTGNSQVYLLFPSGNVALPIVSVSSTQIVATIPATYLLNPAALGIQVVTGNNTGGPVYVQVYNYYTDSIAATSLPTSIPYGATASTTFNATVTRGSITADGAVPAGQVTFTLNGTGAVSGYSAQLGTATLSQVSTQGTYLDPFTEVMDQFGTGKLVAADLNGDGFVDVVGIPSYYYQNAAQSPYLQVMLSTGVDGFQTEQDVFTSCEAQDFAVGDINGDNIPDLVVVCNSNGIASGTVSNLVAYYMLGNGDGTFQNPTPFGGNSFIGAPTQVVLGQFNNDGYLDIAVIDGINGYIQVISPFGNPGNPYGPEVGFSTYNGSVVAAGAADFNQDGLTDLVLDEYSSAYGSGAILVLNSQGNNNGFYLQSQPTFNANTYNLQSMTITDVNGDGYPDVAIADPGSTNSDPGYVLVFENDTYGDLNQTFSQQINSAFAVAGAPFPTIGQPAPGAAAAPGWNLLYTYLGNDNNIWVGELQRQNQSSWTILNSFDTLEAPIGTEGGPLPNFLVTGDMNGDGYLDFALNGVAQINVNGALVNQYQLQPWYYSNDALASLTSSSQLPTPGVYNLSLSYPGDVLYAPSTGSGTAITITQATPAGGVSGPSSDTYGNSDTFTVTVTGVAGGVAPTGQVVLYSNSNGIGTVNLTPAGGSTSSATLSAQLAAGTDTITAFYSGDGNYLAGYLNPTSIQINQASVQLVLSSSTTATTSGAMVNFQVQASGAVLPTGQSVTLTGLPDATPITLTLNTSGFASYNYGLFAPGNYTIQANYPGSDSLLAASSNQVPLQVAATPVTVTLSSSANPITYPQTINLTANATTGGLGVPDGSVAFENNGSNILTGTLSPASGSSGLLSVGTIDPVTGQTVISVAAGDFNNDGNQDIAALESGGGAATLLISLGNGDGTFQTPASYTSASFGFDPGSVAIAAADFNGDGYTDLVVISSDGYVTILLSQGASAPTPGALTLGDAFMVPFSPVAVATGNFQNNGQQGFAVIGPSNLSVYYGNGSGAFETGPSWSYSFDSATLTGITVADFNQDGYPDIAVSDNLNLDAIVFISTGSESFNSPQVYPVGISATAIASGDINGDAYPDLAVVSNLDSTVYTLINSGAGAGGTFNAGGASYGVASQPTAIAMADFNQDGYADIAVTGTGTGQGGGTTILLGSSTGALVGETSLPNAIGQAIVAADFNGDGNPDLAVGSNAAFTGVYTFVNSAAQTVAAGVALNAGTAPLTAAYSGSNSGQFASSSSSILDEVVNQATPVVTWPAPAPITYGTPLSGTQLDASSATPGIFTYTPPANTVLAAGNQLLSVTFAPNDAVDYTGVAIQVPITVTQAGTTITWANPAAITYGTPLTTAQLNATASVPGTFTYTPALGTVLGAGQQTLRVDFAPTDATDYSTSSAMVTIQVNQATPVITWATPAPITYGAKLGAAELNATASTAGTFTYTPASGTLLTAGTHTLGVSFAPADTVDYTTATGSVQLVVNQAAPVITWTPPAAITYGTTLSTVQLDATATPAGGAFTYSPPLGSTLPVGTQTLHVTYVPADTADYSNATAQVPITVRQAATTVTWATPAPITYGTPLSAAQLNATASVPGTFTYTPALGVTLGAGLYNLHVIFTPTDSINYASSTGSVQLQVNPATPAITWNSPAAITYGTKLTTAQLNATASVPGTFVYNPALGTTPTAGLQTLTVIFTPTDAVNYTTASGSVQLQVNQATPVITWSNPAAITYGTTLSSAQLNASATPAGGAFTYSPAAGATLPVGTQTLRVTYVPKDTVDYSNATAQVSIVVNQASTIVTWATPAPITYGTPLSTAQLNATSTVPGTFTYTPALGAVLSAGTQTLKVAFAPNDTTDYTGSTTTVQLQVNPATPVITWSNPAAITYGTALGAAQLNATASTPGTFTYTPAAGTVLNAGTQTLGVSFKPTDTTDYTVATGSAQIVVNQATPSITWPTPAAIGYGTPLSTTQLNATANPAGGTFTYAPPLGTVLPTGTQTLKVTYAPSAANAANYTSASASVSILITPNLSLTSIEPTSGVYQSAATTITLTGTGFTAASIVQLNGVTIPSSYLGPTSMTAVIPASFFLQTSPGAVTVTNPAVSLTSTPATFSVTLPSIRLEFSGPGTAPPGQQPNLNLAFLEGYPLPLEVTLTLSVEPKTAGGPVDPNVLFANGLTTYTFPLAANSTAVPTIQLQTGTIEATITVTLSLTAGGQDVTPAGLQPVVISVPASAPVITSTTLTRNGTTLTVTIQGYSSTRDMTSAIFNFTPAAGATLDDPQLTVDLGSSFATWYGDASSIQYGSAFTYTQNFTLSNDASTIGGVSVTLTNSVGTSNAGTAN